eukprot:scaffold2982_cov154-Isochrysis_galbana.AAC.6
MTITSNEEEVAKCASCFDMTIRSHSAVAAGTMRAEQGSAANKNARHGCAAIVLAVGKPTVLMIWHAHSGFSSIEPCTCGP